jgi:hypothetical protein
MLAAMTDDAGRFLGGAAEDAPRRLCRCNQHKLRRRSTTGTVMAIYLIPVYATQMDVLKLRQSSSSSWLALDRGHGEGSTAVSRSASKWEKKTLDVGCS